MDPIHQMQREIRTVLLTCYFVSIKAYGLYTGKRLRRIWCPVWISEFWKKVQLRNLILPLRIQLLTVEGTHPDWLGPFKTYQFSSRSNTPVVHTYCRVLLTEQELSCSKYLLGTYCVIDPETLAVTRLTRPFLMELRGGGQKIKQINMVITDMARANKEVSRMSR